VNPFQSLTDYEEFVYGLAQRYPELRGSTLVLARRGSGVATLAGDLHMHAGYRLAVYEILTWDAGPVSIQSYSHEVWKGSFHASTSQTRFAKAEAASYPSR